MSGMAEQIEARIAADGGGIAGVAPGTDGGAPAAPAAPPAGAQNTDTAAGGGPPETIPYARFKEVNDSYQNLKGYEELAQYGYDPDSLGRLAAFEAQYMTDPIGTWTALASDLELPQEVRDVIEQHLGAGATPPTPPSGDGSDSTEGASPTTVLPPHVQETLDWAAQKRAEEARLAEEAAVNGVLNSIKGHWDSLDERDGVKTPENIKLTFISAAAARGGYRDAESIAEAARADLMAYRDSELGQVVSGSRRTGSPLAVPGGTLGSTPPVSHGGSIRDASRQAIADMQAGKIPTGE